MFGFKSKPKTSDADTLDKKEPDAPGGPAPIPSGLETVCPETGPEMQRYYAEPARELATRLKDLPLSDTAPSHLPSRAQWQHALAREAITMLDVYPLQAITNVHGENRWDFHRAVYLRALVAGLGDWVRAHRFKASNGYEVAVIDDRWSKVITLAPDTTDPYKRLAPSITEMRIAQQIGALALSEEFEPTVKLLFLDSFGADHQLRNPFAGAIENAQTKIHKRYVNQGIRIDTLPGMQWQSTATPTAAIQGAAPQPRADTSPKAPAEASRAEAKPAPEPKTQAAGESPSETQKGGSDKAQTPPSKAALAKAGIAAQPQKETPDAAPVTQDEGDKLDIEPHRITQLLQARLASGVVSINNSGALLHGTGNGVGLICPRAIEQISQMLGQPPEQVEKTIHNEMIEPSLSSPLKDYRLRRKGRGWKRIRLWILKEQYRREIFGDELPESNSDIEERPAEQQEQQEQQ